MQTKLTLRLDRALIRRAKSHSRRSGKSVSGLVADFFSLLEEDAVSPDQTLTPRVRALLGILEGAGASEKDYRTHLTEKYR
jgi:hypothetical protein